MGILEFTTDYTDSHRLNKYAYQYPNSLWVFNENENNLCKSV
ncbi:hypothetical protein SAMN05192581_10557 [Bacteroides ovatus]|uniref:Uncharacterized protein n=1 Tax=Bacteroides ovatus TaxID=28116 RepID=A0A1G6GAB4_BACOV|nr:hypothetical protein SAMN05192581_10557 [Bacteroides ovatus]